MTTQVEILQFLHYNPLSSRVEIAEDLTNAPNERTLKRIIADCVQKGYIIAKQFQDGTKPVSQLNYDVDYSLVLSHATDVFL